MLLIKKKGFENLFGLELDHYIKTPTHSFSSTNIEKIAQKIDEEKTKAA